MIKGILVIILGFFCVGCASNKVNITSVKTMSISKLTQKISINRECKMMSHGYLVCPKIVRN